MTAYHPKHMGRFSILLLVVLASCGSPKGAELAGLPAPATLEARNVSLTASSTRRGIDTLAHSSNDWELPPALTVRSDEGGIGWAVYQLDPPAGLTPQRVEMQLHYNGHGWIGLANFASGSWEFTEHDMLETRNFELDGAGCLSPGGHVYVAVVAYNGFSLTVNSVSLIASDNKPGWKTVTVDGTGTVGGYTSLALVNGKPAISYCDFGNKKLKYAFSSNADGSSGWTTVIAANTSTGIFSSLAVINGKPAISYCEDNSGNLMYAYSSSIDGSTGWTSLSIDTSGSLRYRTSLAAIDSRPAIGYCMGNEIGGDLKYAYSNAANGSSGWTTLTVDSPGDVGFSSSLVLASGKPAISYYDSTAGQLKFAYSATSNGSSGWTALTVDSGFGVEYALKGAALSIVNGLPAISYLDSTTYALKYAYSSAADGSSGWTTTTVDASGEVGEYNSLAVINGRPAVSYYDATNGALVYAQSSTADGSSGWETEIVDFIDDIRYTSLLEVNGRPAISYMDATNWDLKYAVQQD